MSQNMKPSDLAVLADLGFPHTAQRIEMHLKAVSDKEDWLTKNNKNLQDENMEMSRALTRIYQQDSISSEIAYDVLISLGKKV